MHFSNLILALSGLLSTAIAGPLVQSESFQSSLTSRGHSDPCDGGRDWCGWFDAKKHIEPQCKCPKGFNWDEKKHKCRAPPLPKPRVQPHQKAVCAKDRNTYCDYDANEDLCREDGANVVIVVEINVTINVLKPQIEEECEKPKCATGKYYDSSSRKCKYPTLSKPEASSCRNKGGRPVCAKTPSEFCDFDEREAWCEDDGINCLQCIEPKKSAKEMLESIFSDVSKAVDTLGYDCLERGGGCKASDKDYAKLCIGVQCVGDLLCDLLGVIGLGC